MSDDLLPCPFCGETPDKITDATRVLGTWNLVHRCKVIGPFKIEMTERQVVVDTWNRRALPATDEREAALREAAAVCDYIIKNIEILKADGQTYETPRVQKIARGLVDLARQDILALIGKDRT